MMDEQPTTCELVDQGELDRRYLAGRLSDDEAAAFEAHFFGCDRCWALVKGGAGVRAALASGSAVPATPPRAWWKPLAIAAGLGLVALGIWQVAGTGPGAERDAVRGAGDSLAVRSEVSAGTWRAAWPAVSAATSYQVRVFAADGRLLLSRQVTDTSLEMAADSLSALGGGPALYLDVQGFDMLRRPVTRSPLIPLRLQPAP